MPSGREIHSIPEYQPPSLDEHVLEAMCAPPDVNDELTQDMSSDDDVKSPFVPPVGAFPGASAGDYGRSSTAASSNTYY